MSQGWEGWLAPADRLPLNLGGGKPAFLTLRLRCLIHFLPTQLIVQGHLRISLVFTLLTALELLHTPDTAALPSRGRCPTNLLRKIENSPASGKGNLPEHGTGRRQSSECFHDALVQCRCTNPPQT